jgi:hypothetical protein
MWKFAVLGLAMLTSFAARAYSIDVDIDARSGLPRQIVAGKAGRSWLAAPLSIRVRNEATGAVASPVPGKLQVSVDGKTTLAGSLNALALKVSQQWSASGVARVWKLTFEGNGPRAGHEVMIDWPILAPGLQVFTPSERGTIDVAACPSCVPTAYATPDYDKGRCYVLPLVSVMDPKADSALTIALPADANIPHFQVQLIEGRMLRLTLAHRGMGGGKPSPLELLLWTHPADYRSAMAVYAERFPAWFTPGLPRGPYEGVFWYHHIQDHPAFDEMARQNVRYIWSSFWFTHLGDYMPDGPVWYPYSYANWWKLGKTMDDEQIRKFIAEMHAHGIGAYAYFNLTEYGGAGGRQGNAAAAEKILREKFANALIKNAAGSAIPTWEGAMAMNPGKRYSLWPFLEEQVRRHIERIPAFDGFAIDRLDWASVLDYGHDDGLTMVGNRPAENMAVPVGEAVQAVCRLTHAVGKRVLVNQFWRVEVLKDTDGVCHEADYLLGLGYLTPYRPAAAWHHAKDYQGSLTQFEGQLKRRLYWALFPQMIAHRFPISQQAANPRAADLLEIYAPLFELLMGKQQVLLPHCVAVDGANDANLYINGAGHYVAPVTSRTSFLSRGRDGASPAIVTLRVPDGRDIRWVHVYSAESPPYRAVVEARDDAVYIRAEKHATASMIVAGKGAEPALARETVAAKGSILRRLFGELRSASPRAPRPAIEGEAALAVRIIGTQLGTAGPLDVLADGRKLGRLSGDVATFDWPAGRLGDQPPLVSLVAGDEGTWFLPYRVELLSRSRSGKLILVAQWTTSLGSGGDSLRRETRLPLAWCAPEEVAAGKVEFVARDMQRGGQWRGRFGSKAVWIADVSQMQQPQAGYQLRADEGAAFTWNGNALGDARVLVSPGRDAPRPATCWHRGDQMHFEVVPPDTRPYRLTVYVLDFDRKGRETSVAVRGEAGSQDLQRLSKADTVAGTYLTWLVSGRQTIEVKNLGGYNAVISAIFVDPAK